MCCETREMAGVVRLTGSLARNPSNPGSQTFQVAAGLAHRVVTFRVPMLVE
jgi:hypothetical protein